MAHSLTPANLLYPQGELQPKMFPDRAAGANAEDALEEWLTQADLLIVNVPQNLQNAAARAYCYGRAFRAMAMKIAALPDSSSDAGAPMNVGTSWSQDRIDYWRKRADEQERIFAGITGDVSAADSTAAQGGSVRVVAVW